MRRPGGYATITDPDRPLQEYDTCRCSHCGRILFVKPHTLSTVYLLLDPVTRRWREVPGAGCYGCGMQPVCLPCHDAGVCTPLEQRLEWAEQIGGQILRAGA